MIFGSPPIVTNGLVLNLDAANMKSYPKSGTTWRDLSGFNNSGSLTNGPTFNSANGGSIVFDGVDDYISCGNKLTVQITAGTISAWVATLSPGSTYRGIITKQSSYGLFVKDGILITYDWGAGGGDRTTGINIANGLWNYVAMTFTTSTGTPSNNATIYLNGINVLVTTIKYFNDNMEVQIAAGGTLTGLPGGSIIQQLNGRVSNVQIYNRALSQSEIQQNYNAQKSRFNLQ